MPTDRAPAAAVDLAWSLWGELGVPSPVRKHERWNVVPEPLIVFTAALGDRDRRLRDNALAWCLAHVSLVSTRALTNTFTRERWGVGAMADFATTMQQLGGIRWPGAGVGVAFRPGAKPMAPIARLDAPSQLALRLRALLGVSVRAEVVRALLASPREQHTFAELADKAMATKRQATEAAEQLSWAGVASVERTRQPYLVRLARPAELRRLVAPVPPEHADWGPLLRLVFAAVEALEGTSQLPKELAAAELHRVFRNHDDQMRRLGLEPPALRPAATFDERARAWLDALLQRVAEGKSPEKGA